MGEKGRMINKQKEEKYKNGKPKHRNKSRERDAEATKNAVKQMKREIA